MQLDDTPAGNGSPGNGPPQNQPAGNVAYDSMGGQATGSDSLGLANVDPFGPMFYLNGYFGQAPGWSGPSWQADLYYPWHIVPGRSVFFGALEAAVDDYGKGYFNAGAGYREYFPEQDRILGAWGWVDWDDTNNTGWLRFSGSLESLGKYLDVRANWYVLADQGGSTVTSGFTGSPFFQGYNIDLNRRTVTEDAFDGFDLEFGGRLPFLGRYGVSGYVGPYYLHSDSNGGTWGVEGRINVAVTDNCQVNVTMQHDNVFDTTTFVNVSLALPDGMPTKWFKPQDVIDKLSSMVIRRDRVPVLDEVSNESVPFLNVPGTTPGNPPNTRGDLPVVVVHVDPNLPAGIWKRNGGEPVQFVGTGAAIQQCLGRHHRHPAAQRPDGNEPHTQRLLQPVQLSARLEHVSLAHDRHDRGFHQYPRHDSQRGASARLECSDHRQWNRLFHGECRRDFGSAHQRRQRGRNGLRQRHQQSGRADRRLQHQPERVLELSERRLPAKRLW